MVFWELVSDQKFCVYLSTAESQLQIPTCVILGESDRNSAYWKSREVSSPERGRYRVLLGGMESQLQRGGLAREIVVGRLGKGAEFAAQGRQYLTEKEMTTGNMRKRNEP